MSDKTPQLIEIARSFSRKINLGNYEVADFFTSAKMEVPEKEADATSQELFNFCRKETERSANEYLDELREKKSAEAQRIGEMWRERYVEECEATEINAEAHQKEQITQNKSF